MACACATWSHWAADAREQAGQCGTGGVRRIYLDENRGYCVPKRDMDEGAAENAVKVKIAVDNEIELQFCIRQKRRLSALSQIAKLCAPRDSVSLTIYRALPIVY